MNKVLGFDVVSDNYRSHRRLKELDAAAVELGYKVEYDLTNDFLNNNNALLSQLFPATEVTQDFLESQAHREDNKVVTAYSILGHIYPLVVHGKNWELEVTLDRKEALKFRYELGKLQQNFPENALMEYELTMNAEREVSVINIRSDVLFTAGEPLDLAIHRSGIYWVDILEQALQHFEKVCR